MNISCKVWISTTISDQRFEVVALKDVIGRPGTNELSFSRGETLIITKKNDDPWWEGINEDGESGLVNKNDVKILTSDNGKW